MKKSNQIQTQKQRPSKFFEYFIKNYGESATKTVNDDEIFKNLKSLYLDLAFGNLQQEKYFQYLYSDFRIMQIAANDLHQKVMESFIVAESLKFARNMNFQATSLEQFGNTLLNAETKYFTYSVLHKGVTGFLMSGDINALISISVQFNNPMNRNSKSVLL
jgi:hypothetical protein